MKKTNILKVLSILTILGSTSLAHAEYIMNSNADSLQALQNQISEDSGLVKSINRLSSGNRIQSSDASIKCQVAAFHALQGTELSPEEIALFPSCEICAEAPNTIIAKLCHPVIQDGAGPAAEVEEAPVPAEIIEEDLPISDARYCAEAPHDDPRCITAHCAEFPNDAICAPAQDAFEETDDVYTDAEPATEVETTPTTEVITTQEEPVVEIKTVEEDPIVEAIAPAADLFSPQFVEGGKCSLDKTAKNGTNHFWFAGLVLMGTGLLRLRKKA